MNQDISGGRSASHACPAQCGRDQGATGPGRAPSYPGKLTQVDTLRVGCIGAIDERVMRAAVQAIAETLAEQGIRQVGPAAAVKTAYR